MNVKTAYVLLWFPKPSETFIFNEVVNLRRLGLPLKVFTLYGRLKKDLSPQMQTTAVPIERLGLSHIPSIPAQIRFWLDRDRTRVADLFGQVPLRRWNGIEKGGESLWAFCCAFYLARRFLEEGIGHIHAPWACGPATAAWVASQLTGIPFSFTGRAHDIYPPDGAIGEKIRDAVLVRSETRTGGAHLRRFAPAGMAGKFHVTRNGVPLERVDPAPVPMVPPYRLLALGRFVPTKGFDVLLRACRLLVGQKVDLRLTLAGDGWLKPVLKALAGRLGLAGRVAFPGFVTHDRIGALFHDTDVFVMPCRVDRTGNRDGLPTVILEALLHRVPVVATDVSGIKELIEDGVTGRCVPAEDPVGLAGAIAAMLADRPAALAMAERGRQQVADQYNAIDNHRRLIGLYARMLSAGR